MLVLIIIIITKNMKNMIGTIRRDILMSLQVKTFGTVIIDHAVDAKFKGLHVFKFP